MNRPKRERKERVPGMELEESDITDAILDSAQAITGVLQYIYFNVWHSKAQNNERAERVGG
jgi:hypothetical protein